MYRMNGYYAHFSFARAQHTASDKPIKCLHLLLALARKVWSSHLSHSYKDQESKCIGEYVRLFQITESYFIHIIFTMSQCIIVLYLHRRLLTAEKRGGESDCVFKHVHDIVVHYDSFLTSNSALILDVCSQSSLCIGQSAFWHSREQ